MFLSIDNQKVFYTDSGSSERVFLLIHNAGGSHRFFDPQISILEKLGRVIAVDLPGHGKSQITTNPTVENFADTIIVFSKKLELKNIIGVGLNYGADVLIEVASKSNILTSIFMIDPPIFISSEVRNLIEENIKSLALGDAKTHAEDLVSKSFKNPTEENTKLARKVFESMDTDLLANLYSDLLIWDKKTHSLLKNISIPMSCVLTEASLCDIKSLKEVNSSIEIQAVNNSLYWATLDVPDQINAMLNKIIHKQGNP